MSKVIHITTQPTSSLMDAEDDWDELDEDEKQERIYECASDSQLLPEFSWEPLPAPPAQERKP